MQVVVELFPWNYVSHFSALDCNEITVRACAVASSISPRRRPPRHGGFFLFTDALFVTSSVVDGAHQHSFVSISTQSPFSNKIEHEGTSNNSRSMIIRMTITIYYYSSVLLLVWHIFYMNSCIICPQIDGATPALIDWRARCVISDLSYDTYTCVVCVGVATGMTDSHNNGRALSKSWKKQGL